MVMLAVVIKVIQTKQKMGGVFYQFFEHLVEFQV